MKQKGKEKTVSSMIVDLFLIQVIKERKKEKNGDNSCSNNLGDELC